MQANAPQWMYKGGDVNINMPINVMSQADLETQRRIAIATVNKRFDELESTANSGVISYGGVA
jgi:hypothetical protein